jgi:hypothetical protein
MCLFALIVQHNGIMDVFIATGLPYAITMGFRHARVVSESGVESRDPKIPYLHTK